MISVKVALKMSASAFSASMLDQNRTKCDSNKWSPKSKLPENQKEFKNVIENEIGNQTPPIVQKTPAIVSRTPTIA